LFFFFFSSRRRHTRSYGDWSSDVCSSDLIQILQAIDDFLIPPALPESLDEDLYHIRMIPIRRGMLQKIARFVEQLEIIEIPAEQIGRASCRERVEIGVGAVSLKKKEKEMR